MNEKKMLLAVKEVLNTVRPLRLLVNEKVAVLKAAIEVLRVEPD